MAGLSANERRIIELFVKATGDADLKRIASELKATRKAAVDTHASLSNLEHGFQHLASIAKNAVGFLAIEQALHHIVEIGHEAIEEMSQLAATIQKVGVSAADFQALQFGAKLSEVDPEALNKGLIKLSVNMADLAGKNSAATKSLRELGITAKTGTVEAMEKLADKFASLKDGAEKTALAAQIFGARMGANLIPLLNKGGEGIAEMAKEAKDLGLILSGEALAGAEMFHEEMVKVGAVTDANIKKFMGGLAPALVTIAEEMLGAAKGTGDMTKSGRALGDALVAVEAEVAGNIVYLKSYGLAVFNFLKAMGDALGGWRALAEGNANLADSYMESAQHRLSAASGYYQNVDKAAAAATASVTANYRANLAAAAKLGAKIDAGRGGAGGADGDPESAAAKRSSRKAAADKEAAKAAKDHAAAQKQLADEITKSIATSDSYFASLDQQVTALEEAADPTLAYDRAMKELGFTFKATTLSLAAYNLKQRELAKTRDDALEQLHNMRGQQDRIDEFNQGQQDQLDAEKEKWQFLADAVGEATYAIVAHTEKTSTAVKQMVATIISEIAKLAAKKFAEQIVGSLFPGEAKAAAKGAAFTAGGVTAFAAGGILNAPQFFGMAGGGIGVAGEAGPEMVAPLKRDSTGNLGVGAVAPVVTINNYAGADVRASPTQNGIQIDIVRRVIADDIRRGGNAVASAIEGTYRVGRQAAAFS